MVLSPPPPFYLKEQNGKASGGKIQNNFQLQIFVSLISLADFSKLLQTVNTVTTFLLLVYGQILYNATFKMMY